MHFYNFVFKNVMRRKVRSTLTGIGVAVAMTAVVALLGVTSGFESQSKDFFESKGVDMVVVRAGVATRSTSTIPELVGDQLRKLPHVTQAEPTLVNRVSFTKDELIGMPVNGWHAGSFLFKSVRIPEGNGRTLTKDDHSGILLGTVLARKLKRQVGDEVEIERKNFKVVGIYESFNVLENGSAIVLLEDLQELMDRQGKVSEFQIKLAPSDAAEHSKVVQEVSKAITDLKDLEKGTSLGLKAMPTKEFVSSAREIQLAHVMAWVTSVIALVIGSVGMLNTMIMSVLERTQEIGILRAIGWRKIRIFRMILLESFCLTLAGAAVGTLAAMALTRILSQFTAAESYLQRDIPLSVVGIGFLMSLVVGLIGGAYPAYRGVSLPPTEALRYE